jgi:hypothetical protein
MLPTRDKIAHHLNGEVVGNEISFAEKRLKVLDGTGDPMDGAISGVEHVHRPVLDILNEGVATRREQDGQLCGPDQPLPLLQQGATIKVPKIYGEVIQCHAQPLYRPNA